MTEITNYTLHDFMNQPIEKIEEYMTVFKFLNPVKTKLTIFNMKLKEVESIKQMINSGVDGDLIEIVIMVQEIEGRTQKIKGHKVLDMPIIDFFGLISSIREQMDRIIRAEENGLTPTYTDLKWEAVNGSERMAKFGIYNTLERLANGDALKYKEYMEMSYSEVFTILLMRKTSSEIEREMSLIK